MIRCIPVDGSPAFEVDADAPLERWHEDGTREHALARDVASSLDPNGWEQVLSTNPQSELLRVESWRERAERLERELDATFAADTPWPLPEVLAKLAHAADLLFDQYNYDGHGYEEIVSTRDAARALLTSFHEKAQR